MIVIVDYDAGNVGSIQKMLLRLGVESEISGDPEKVASAMRLVLPGVGKYDYGMTALQNRGLVDALNVAVLERKVPILGICLGLQLMAKCSEEGECPGLGWFDAEVKRFNFSKMDACPLKVPHMGWTPAVPAGDTPLFDAMYERSRFYFVHSYHIVCSDPSIVLTRSAYGYEFISGLARKNIFGVQFHPEKSHKFGIRLFENFLKVDHV